MLDPSFYVPSAERADAVVHAAQLTVVAPVEEDEIDEDTPLSPSPMGVGHARQAEELDRRHRADGLDVVRLSPGFVYGPGGLFASAFVEQGRQGRLRCIGQECNWWSCVHVDDLAAAYAAAPTGAQPGRRTRSPTTSRYGSASSPTW